MAFGSYCSTFTFLVIHYIKICQLVVAIVSLKMKKNTQLCSSQNGNDQVNMITRVEMVKVTLVLRKILDYSVFLL